MAQAIIFDLNGVFLISPFLSDRFSSAYGVPKEEFLMALSSVMKVVRLPGAPSAYSLFKPHLDRWGISLLEAQFYEFWFSAEQENTLMVDLARTLKAKGVRLFILSNNFRERSEFYLARFPFLTDIFEKLYFSWQTGYTKDDAGAYRLVMRENRLSPGECLFFDDSKENISVALSLGIDAHLFGSSKECGSVLNKRGLP